MITTLDPPTIGSWVVAAILFLFVIWCITAWVRAWGDGERQALLTRCEQQHQLWMKGDSRGFYGEYPPAKLDADGSVVMPIQLPSVGTSWAGPIPYNPDEHPNA